MLRALTILLLTTSPTLAWEARSGPVCELIHNGESASVHVTYNQAVREYSIAITPDRPWSQGPVFAMRFEGTLNTTITTNRHVISDGGETLTVTDSGFGNVLNGLEFNSTATALLGDQSVVVTLNGAAPAVRDFRACTSSLSI